MGKRLYFILILLLLLGFYLNYLPHNQYKYPLHVDEWTHLTYAKHLNYDTPLYFSDQGKSLEHGFHILLAVLDSIGVNYLLMFNLFPAFFSVLISLALFILVRKYFDEASALFSVFFFIMLESSNALLGSMFLVPLSLGLFFIPIGLFLVNSRLLFLVIAFTLVMHPFSGIALLILLNCFLLNEIIETKRINYKLILQQIIGIVLALPLFLDPLLEKGLGNLQFNTSIIPFYFIPRVFGYLIMGIILIGFYLIAYQRKYVFNTYILVMLSLILVYYQFRFNFLIFYERNLMYLFESFSIPFGVFFGCVIGKIKKYQVFFILVLLIVLGIFMLPGKVESTKQVYHIINENEYSDFMYIRENLNGKAVLDPWKAIAFTPIAEREIYSRIPPGPNEIYLNRNEEVFSFFNQSCSNLTFLEENNIKIVYGECKGLRKVKNNIFVYG